MTERARATRRQARQVPQLLCCPLRRPDRKRHIARSRHAASPHWHGSRPRIPASCLQNRGRAMSVSQRDWRQVRSISQDKLGHDELHPGQAKALQAVLEGRDTLAIMPAGGGKSAIYQIAALMLPGPTIVVSPLISLQRDQLEAIEESELAPAAVVNSTLSASERARAFDELEKDLEFIFVAPRAAPEPRDAGAPPCSPSLLVRGRRSSLHQRVGT